MVAAENEATQMYMQLAESTDNRLAVAVLKDIANEERVHAGEFLKLLYELVSDEKALYDKGDGEVEEIVKSQLQQTTRSHLDSSGDSGLLVGPHASSTHFNEVNAEQSAPGSSI